ncbi:MAG: YchF/TatD family DNA exonuclease [Candidatus Aureabacteria bacterium]|nr:YchF/TatD family DNA exonuclease [Candidatus Auribacterota bacterium]
MLFDSHCHLTLKDFHHDIDDVLKRASKKNIRIIISGDTLESSKEVISLIKEKKHIFPHLYATSGYHPYYSDDFDPAVISQYRTLIKESSVVALGEIGLDYYRENSLPENQKKTFQAFLKLSIEEDIPIVIHLRDAEDDLINILDKNGYSHKGTIHCFSSENPDFAKEFLKRGFMISFAGQVTFPKADSLREVVKEIPLNRLLIETDAPYLAPQARRGKRNEPSYIEYTAKKIAEIKDISVEDLGRITSLNTMRVYRINDDKAFMPKICYKIKNSLYINLTNKCSNDCDFCVKKKDNFIYGYNLKLKNEPDYEDIIRLSSDEEDFDEIVFCGLGEPTYRLDLLKKVAAYFKGMGKKVRLNTNGQGNIINKKNIIPELEGLIDEMSISLNAENKEKYQEICKSVYGIESYSDILDFVEKSSKSISVTLTVVKIPEVNIEKCRKISQNLGVSFRVREEYFKNI